MQVLSNFVPEQVLNSMGPVLGVTDPNQVTLKEAAQSVAGFAWMAACGLMGVLRGGYTSPQDLPDPVKGLRFNDQPDFWTVVLQAHLGRESPVFNLLGSGTMLIHIGRGLAEYAHGAGLRKFWEDYRATLQGSERLPIHPHILEVGRKVYAQWLEHYARIHQLNVTFEGLEKIPQEGHVVYVLFPHSSIYPDFFFAMADPRFIPVADAFNFRDNPQSRAFGISLATDLMGMPLVDRRHQENNEARMNALLDSMIRYGIRPAWFAQGGRVFTAYTDEGELDRAGFYAINPDKKNLKTYVQMGGAASNAVLLAEKTSLPVSVVVVTLRGPEFVMPRYTRHSPFIQPNRIGQNLVYRVVESIRVDPPKSPKEKGRSLIDLKKRVPEIARKDLEIDSYLENVLDRWGTQRGYFKMGERYRQLAREREIFSKIVDMLRCIHPHYQEDGINVRASLKSDFIDLINTDSPDRQKSDHLLGEVCRVVPKAQFRVPETVSQVNTF